MAVDLEPGAHTVELRFVPQGLIAGAAISGLSLMALVGWQIGAFRRRRRKWRKRTWLRQGEVMRMAIPYSRTLLGPLQWYSVLIVTGDSCGHLAGRT